MTNFVTNIAIVGSSGHCGGAITSAILSAKKHKLTAITRLDSKSALPSGLHDVKKVDYSSLPDVINALQGQDVLISCLSLNADPTVLYTLIDAAIAAGVRFIMPNEWGGDISNEAVSRDTFLLEKFQAVRDYVEKNGNGKTSWIGCACGFWYEFSLAGTEARYGFDFKKKDVTFYNDGHLKINTSTWSQIGRGVAQLLSLPIDRDATTGTGPVISDWANRAIKIRSFSIDQHEMFESVLRATGDKPEDWTVDHEDVVERYNRGRQLMQQGQRMLGFCTCLYSRNFYPDALGTKFDNELLGLPEEDLDTATKTAVGMAARGEHNAHW
ncbi:uncharacterized protein AB675_3150 [Cyphellophora attinorum]|uniref:NAD(P)-binding domain-containing protein n=1 Tax=Cyphellophora attinorum TaxID=1664694 RepID=A0A0N1HQQ4_9EURO|nr:uncharacterized protein AB675_3150 [Phialophora attinorum]KPI37903.1 hypothetical protein AB675_3150 [Phialophora attinorum]